MSVQTQIDRINAAKNDIGAAIAEKGTTVPSGTKIDGMAALIRAIQGGGGSGGTHESCIPYEAKTIFNYTVDAVDGAQYGFALNDTGYYESQNKEQKSSYALCRVNLAVLEVCDIEFGVINYAESNFDYGMFGALDVALGKNASADSNVKKSYKSEHSASEMSLVYENVPVGNHFIDVKYIKDSSGNENNDSLQFKIKSISGETVMISAEYYPTISNTEPMRATLDALKLKGVNTDGADFDDIAGMVSALKVGATIATGKITPASATETLTITHGLGVEPEIFIIGVTPSFYADSNCWIQIVYMKNPGNYSNRQFALLDRGRTGFMSFTKDSVIFDVSSDSVTIGYSGINFCAKSHSWIAVV